MQNATEEYRGFTIVVEPIKDQDELWDFRYRLARAGEGEARVPRAHTVGGHASPEVACLAGIEVARTEVDNLLALEQARSSRAGTPDR